MKTQAKQHFVYETPSPGVRVVRFNRPQYNSEIFDYHPVKNSPVYQELHDSALAGLSAGDTVIINFGLIESFTSMFYSLLLAVRETVQGCNARLVLCRLTPVVKECIDLFHGEKLFELQETESRAVSEASSK